jgi:hypothetical protein
MLRHDREVAEDAPDRQLRQERIGLRAVRALVVAVLDDERRAGIPADVVVGRRRRRAGGR